MVSVEGEAIWPVTWVTIEEVASGIEPGSSVAVIAVENLWAIPFIEAVRDSGGVLVDQFRVPSDVVAEVRQAAQQGS